MSDDNQRQRQRLPAGEHLTLDSVLSKSDCLSESRSNTTQTSANEHCLHVSVATRKTSAIAIMARAPAPTQTSAQRANRRIIKSISNAWRISRQSKRPRGLENIRNNCYRHALLQNLLHLPRFLNWIHQHNMKGRNWPCNTEHSSSLHQVETSVFSDLVEKANDNLIKDCVPCLLKDLVVAYWGPDEGDKEASNNMAVFSHDHDAMLPIHRFAERYFCCRPADHDEILGAGHNSKKSQVEKNNLTRSLCISNMTRQQDAQEFMTMLLGKGCELSLDPVGQ